MNKIIFNEAYKEFGEIKALNGLNLSINKGEIFALLGHNGAGKTTALRLMLGLLPPTKGDVSVFGIDPIRDGYKLREKCGVLSEDIGLYEPLSVYDNLRYYAEIYGVDKALYNKRIDELLKLLDISHVKHLAVKGFSTGMKKKVAIIRTLIHNPEIILLDEPTNGLDPVSIEKLRETILLLKSEFNSTFIITTHNLHEVVKICDRISILKHGQNIVTKNINEVMEESGQNLIIKTSSNLDNDKITIKRKIENIEYVNECIVGHNEILIKQSNNNTSDIIKELVLNKVAIESVITEQNNLLDLYMEVENN
ncbi:ABC transporter ATP-binding protein [Clostridiaceae bacterium M8S5]|nr:ABC transporter ATP-binding protein [Clostridiaceae bacterium M8S5]